MSRELSNCSMFYTMGSSLTTKPGVSCPCDLSALSSLNVNVLHRLLSKHYHGDFDPCKATSLSIWVTHRLANASSVNLFADARARSRIARVSSDDKESACENRSANSASEVAWKPEDIDQTSVLPFTFRVIKHPDRNFLNRTNHRTPAHK